MEDYLEAVDKAPPGTHKPLGRKRLAESERIESVEKDLHLLEDSLVRQGGGGCCLSTDGGKVGHATTRAVMVDCDAGTIWLDVYDAGSNKKDAAYLADTLMERIRALEKRGWRVKGCVTDNAASELASMEKVREIYEREYKRLFAVLTCARHTGSLAQGVVFPWPAYRKQQEEKFTLASLPWAHFTEWLEAVDVADEISREVRNRAKLRSQLHKVITDTPRFKDMKPLMPIQGNSVKMWTRTLVTQRFMELFDAILYMLTWQNNKVIKTMVDEKG